nr:envelope stress response membrane protein PspC [Erythrobacter sp. 3-20A1M]
MTNTPRTKLYRDKQNAKLMGVCSGIADYTGLDVNLIRIGVVIAVLTGALASIVLPLYFLAGLILEKKPAYLYTDREEQKYWQGVRQNPKRTVREVRGKFRDIDRRLAEVENYYVSSNPRLNAEIERLR